MNKSVYLPLILLFVSLVLITHSHAELCYEAAGYTAEDIEAALDAAPWESITHSHGTYGEHTHEQWVKQVELPAGCLHVEYTSSDHPDPEPEPESSIPEGYTTPTILVCTAGPCLEKRPTQFIGPIDIDGNLPPEPEPGEEIYYPTIVIGDKIYWDPSKEPYHPEESDSEPQVPPVFNERVGSGQEATQVEDEAPPMPPSRESVTEAIMEIASGESPPVVTIDERTGETTVIDATTAEEIINGDKPDILDAIVSGSLNFHLSASLRRSIDPLDVVQPINAVVVTEYMLRTGGIGLPQWIEIHNKSNVSVRLDGWKMSVWSHNDRERVITFSRYVYIPANGFLVLVNRSLEADEFGGINPKRVRIHHLREFKVSPWIKRFRLYDADGVLMGNGNQYEPERPELVKGVRYSYDAVNKKVIKWHKNKAWIGSPDDRSTLGWHKFVEEVSAAPRLIRKKTLPWASLKRLDK